MTGLAMDVVICTKDRRRELEACLRSLESQTLLPRHVFVVDASEQPWQDIENISLAVSTHGSEVGLPRQRNLALGLVQAELVAFFDDDVELEPEYVHAMISFFAANPACVGASGNITNDSVRPILSRAYRRACCMANDDGRLRRSGDVAYLRHPRHATRVEILSGCNMVFRRDSLRGRRFDEQLGAYAYMEDADFSMRVGRAGELRMVPEARLIHHKTPSARLPPRSYVEEVFVNSAVLFTKHRTAFDLSRFAFFRRITGRFIAYLLLSLRLRSCEPFRGAVSGIRLSIGRMWRYDRDRRTSSYT